MLRYWILEQFLPQPQMHSYLLIVVYELSQVEKHDAVKKTKDRPTGEKILSLD